MFVALFVCSLSTPSAALDRDVATVAWLWAPQVGVQLATLDHFL